MTDWRLPRPSIIATSARNIGPHGLDIVVHVKLRAPLRVAGVASENDVVAVVVGSNIFDMRAHRWLVVTPLHSTLFGKVCRTGVIRPVLDPTAAGTFAVAGAIQVFHFYGVSKSAMVCLYGRWDERMRSEFLDTQYR